MIDLANKPDPQHPETSQPRAWQFIESGPQSWRMNLRGHVWRPPTDVFETDDQIVVRVEIAGMREDGFTIELEERYLLIRGFRPDVTERRAYHQMEIRFGEFISEVELPAAVIETEVQAVYGNGFLRITMPKAQPKHITIQDD